MPNTFSQADATLANNNLTTVVSTTSNKQIVIGFLISNTGTTSINVDAVLKVALIKPLKRVEWVELDNVKKTNPDKTEATSRH